MGSKYLAAAIVAGLLLTDASAQSVTEASNVSLQAQIGRSEKGFDSCGVRGIVLTTNGKFYDAYDFSITVRPDMFHGLLKGGKRLIATSMDLQEERLPSAVTPAPIKFWIAQELRGKPLLSYSVSPSDDSGYSLMLGELVETYRIIYEILSGERMQFALRYENEKYDTVVSFSGKLSTAQTTAIQTCMSEVFAQLEAKAKK